MGIMHGKYNKKRTMIELKVNLILWLTVTSIKTRWVDSSEMENCGNPENLGLSTSQVLGYINES